jgi:hypothetical protein
VYLDIEVDGATSERTKGTVGKVVNLISERFEQPRMMRSRKQKVQTTPTNLNLYQHTGAQTPAPAKRKCLRRQQGVVD